MIHTHISKVHCSMEYGPVWSVAFRSALVGSPEARAKQTPELGHGWTRRLAIHQMLDASGWFLPLLQNIPKLLTANIRCWTELNDHNQALRIGKSEGYRILNQHWSVIRDAGCLFCFVWSTCVFVESRTNHRSCSASIVTCSIDKMELVLLSFSVSTEQNRVPVSRLTWVGLLQYEFGLVARIVNHEGLALQESPMIFQRILHRSG